MKNSWKTCTVKDLISSGEAEVKTGPFGTQLHASDYVESGTPVINVRNIGFGGIREEKLEFIAEDTVKRLSSHLLEPDDIVFGRKGAVERHVFISSSQAKWFQGSDCIRLRVKSPILNNRFLSYSFLVDAHKRWMMNQSSHGATMASLNQEIISRIPLRLPPLPTQLKIASILSAYDDLIENNTRRIEILEEMAQTIYREWFVNFRFPGHEKVRLMESGLGPRPEGWEIEPVAHFGKVITGKTPSKKVPEYYGGYMPFIKTPDMHDNIFCTHTNEHLSESGVESQKTKTLPANSICVSCIGTVGIVSITSEPSQTNQQINSLVLRYQSEREFLYFSLLELKDTIMRYGATGATMANLSKGKFESLKVVCPTEEVTASFHEMVSPHFDQIKLLQLKNTNLRHTRDLLLPKLISGEIDIEAFDVESEVEELVAGE